MGSEFLHPITIGTAKQNADMGPRQERRIADESVKPRSANHYFGELQRPVKGRSPAQALLRQGLERLLRAVAKPGDDGDESAVIVGPGVGREQIGGGPQLGG